MIYKDWQGSGIENIQKVQKIRMIEPISSSVTTLKYNRRDSLLRNSKESIISTIQNEENFQEEKGQYESQEIQNSQ